MAEFILSLIGVAILLFGIYFVLTAPVMDEEKIEDHLRTMRDLNKAIREGQEVSREYRKFKNGGKML